MRYQHITDNGHIVLKDGEGIDGNPVQTGSPIGRFIFTDWDSLTISASGKCNYICNCVINPDRRYAEGRTMTAGIDVTYP